MANSLDISTFIVKESARLLRTNCATIKALNTDWNKYFGKTVGPLRKGGTTIYIPIPEIGKIRTGWTMDTADAQGGTVPLTFGDPVGCDFYFTESDMIFKTERDMAEFSKNFLQPKIGQLASYIDAYFASYAKNYIYNVMPVDTLGTAPDDLKYFLGARRMVKEGLAPEGDPLRCIISPRTEASIVGKLAGQYNPGNNISQMYEQGQMSKALGMDWYTSQNMPSHTHGTCTTGTTPTVTGYGANTLTITGCTSGGTLKAGDSLYLSACYPVNFETKNSYSAGQRFVATAATTASTTTLTVTVKPDIVISGALQTVSGTPVGSTVTFHQTTSGQVVQNDLILHRDAFAIAFADLYMPQKGIEMGGKYSVDGVSVRWLKGFDIKTSQELNRLDVLFAIGALRTGWAARIIS